MSRITQALLGIVVACAIPATVALALGRGLSESKEELNLKYDVLVSEGDAERMTVTFELEDEGRLNLFPRSIYMSPAPTHRTGAGPHPILKYRWPPAERGRSRCREYTFERTGLREPKFA